MGEEAQKGNQIHLETVAKKMGMPKYSVVFYVYNFIGKEEILHVSYVFSEVEKRRIYDIVNVMEALDAMQKTNKSFYRWDGLSRLPQLMYNLRVGYALIL